MRVMDEFTKQSGVIVDYTTIPRDAVPTTLESDAANNSLPDVAMLPQTGVLRDFACRGLLKPLPTGVQQAIADNYTNDRQTPGMYNGQLYGLWFKAANKSLIWYDAPVLSLRLNLGVSAPAVFHDQLGGFGCGLSHLGDQGA
jgi:alpha-glucoside transport system substrate-binding protein